MAIRFKTDFLRHAQAVGQWAQRRGATASIDAQTLGCELTRHDTRLTLRPQFNARRDGALYYTPCFDASALAFCGWLPYFNRRWPAAIDKREFKRTARELGLATPADGAAAACNTSEAATSAGPVSITCAGSGTVPATTLGSAPLSARLVKPARSSFGHGIRGPYLAHESVTPPAEHFIEAFVLGQIVRAWFWNDHLTVLECFPMPFVTGDGRSTIRSLLREALGPEQAPIDRLDALLALQSLSAASVLEPGGRAVVDFRYVSPLNPTVCQNANRAAELHDSALGRQIWRAGQRLWQAIPAEVRQGTGFVVDAVADATNQLWLLEMNCNAQMHPDCYAVMLDDAFGLSCQAC